jgi:hypothetical protein
LLIASRNAQWNAWRQGRTLKAVKDDDKFVSKAGKHYFIQWDHDKKHREAVTRKLQKIQGLVALVDTWAAQPENTVEYRKYLNNLRQKLHSARTQYKAMAI